MKNNWIVKTLLGFLFLIIFTAITTLANYLVANDKESRARDTEIVEKIEEIKDEQNGKLDEIKTTQMIKFTDILIAIAELKKEVEYINGN